MEEFKANISIARFDFKYSYISIRQAAIALNIINKGIFILPSKWSFASRVLLKWGGVKCGHLQKQRVARL